MSPREPRLRQRFVRQLAVVGLLLSALSLRMTPAEAHPLGNFTTNTAIRIVASPDHADLTYVVDMAEIPALKVRQELGAASGPVPAAAADAWKQATCETIAGSLRVQRSGAPIVFGPSTSELSFPAGQAGLTTLRLTCSYKTAWVTGARAEVTIADDNYADRLGWREITVTGAQTKVEGANVGSSPTALLTHYPAHAVTAPLRQREATFSVSPSADGQSGSAAGTAGGAPSMTSNARGNDGLTARFQGLLDHRSITPLFAIGALLLAVVLGGLHALAPGHGKTIIAAYAIGKEGRTADIVTIGGTVAATHTVGIIILGVLVSATSVVSPDRTLQWASVVSGALVAGVGFVLLRNRIRPMLSIRRAARAKHERGHDHPHDHDHSHDHGHPHDHDHSHGHDHPHDHDHHHGHGDQDIAHEVAGDPRFIVTSHSHGGWSHDHVLPAPGATVRRRELIAMGLAGGLVPSPSALVVLLAAIALGRVPFGIALVVAYGIGLATTLVIAGLAVVRFEKSVRGWASRLSTPAGARIGVLTSALPLVSGFAITGAGLLLLARSIAQL